MLYNLCIPWWKKGQNVSDYVPGQIWAQSEKEFRPYDWSSDANIWMLDIRGGDISARKSFQFFW